MKIWEAGNGSHELVNQDGYHVCNVYNDDYRGTIINAVNSYEAMKEAIRVLQLRIGCGCSELPCALCRHAEDAAEKALALAEGKE